MVTRTLGADLLAVVARLNRLASQRARIPLPFAQGRLLSTIEDQGAARISDLAALDHCSQPTMTMQVRRLEDAGLVSRTVDPDDARAVLIRITPKGVATLRQVRVDRGAAIDPYLERLDDADRQTLDDAVRVMRKLLERRGSPETVRQIARVLHQGCETRREITTLVQISTLRLVGSENRIDEGAHHIGGSDRHRAEKQLP